VEGARETTQKVLAAHSGGSAPLAFPMATEAGDSQLQQVLDVEKQALNG